MTAIWLALTLAWRYHLPLDTAYAYTSAAVASETADIPARLLLAMTWRESRFIRRAGPHKLWGETRPHGLRHFICGPIQTTHTTWSECQQAMDPLQGYKFGVQQLNEWRRVCRRWGKQGLALHNCMLGGFAKGTAAAKLGKHFYKIED